jgi:hypothetical protein
MPWGAPLHRVLYLVHLHACSYGFFPSHASSSICQLAGLHPRSFSLHSFHADKSTKKWANHQIFLVYFNYIAYLCKRKNNEIAVAQFVHQ